MIKIKRIYEKAEDKDGFRILIDRLWPRGLSKEKARIDEWLRDIAPSNELRRWFHHDLSRWEAFKKRYREELKGKNTISERIIKVAKKGNVTLTYAAKDKEHNNAIILKEFLEEKISKESRN